jgi:hypothetical protein
MTRLEKPGVSLHASYLEHVVEERRERGHDRSHVHGAVEEVQRVVVARHGLVVAVHQVHHVVDDGVPAATQQSRIVILGYVVIEKGY